MQELMHDYKGKNCIIFGANSIVGMELSKFLSQKEVNLGLIDLESHKHNMLNEINGNSESRIVNKTVSSGNEDSFKNVVDNIVNDLGSVDYLICNFYLEEEMRKYNSNDISVDTWDKIFEKWILNYFLVARATVPYMLQKNSGKLVYMNTTTGYTGEGEGEGYLTENGSIYENACSSAITGMMTSIGRDIIPKGISVNGIALGPNYMNDMERILWAVDFWLSGLCEYAPAQILRLY
ncbi:MAG: SDR family NAD(P)-dependent oxidoreductase [Anaerolineales bacterium]|nr:SDR family NAD(P)-dependent oxidoreductase [Anaerolineales bacterium]